ncbi:apolipoprotein B receptor [Pelobates fuscus]|uniref:apolipoprotein B receptor n=1 Tax=Pelobates fuscus TaxID=191477 RepID=UPI002FE4C603
MVDTGSAEKAEAQRQQTDRQPGEGLVARRQTHSPMDFLQRHLPRVYQAVQNALDYLGNVAAQVFGAPPNAPRPSNSGSKVAIGTKTLQETNTSQGFPSTDTGTGNRSMQGSEHLSKSEDDVEATESSVGHMEPPPAVEHEEICLDLSGVTMHPNQELDLRNRKGNGRTRRDLEYQAHDKAEELSSEIYFKREEIGDLEISANASQDGLARDLGQTNGSDTDVLMDKSDRWCDVMPGHLESLVAGDREVLMAKAKDLENLAPVFKDEIADKPTPNYIEVTDTLLDHSEGLKNQSPLCQDVIVDVLDKPMSIDVEVTKTLLDNSEDQSPVSQNITMDFLEQTDTRDTEVLMDTSEDLESPAHVCEESGMHTDLALRDTQCEEIHLTSHYLEDVESSAISYKDRKMSAEKQTNTEVTDSLQDKLEDPGSSAQSYNDESDMETRPEKIMDDLIPQIQNEEDTMLVNPDLISTKEEASLVCEQYKPILYEETNVESIMIGKGELVSSDPQSNIKDDEECVGEMVSENQIHENILTLENLENMYFLDSNIESVTEVTIQREDIKQESYHELSQSDQESRQVEFTNTLTTQDDEEGRAIADISGEGHNPSLVEEEHHLGPSEVENASLEDVTEIATSPVVENTVNLKSSFAEQIHFKQQVEEQECPCNVDLPEVHVSVEVEPGVLDLIPSNLSVNEEPHVTEQVPWLEERMPLSSLDLLHKTISPVNECISDRGDDENLSVDVVEPENRIFGEDKSLQVSSESYREVEDKHEYFIKQETHSNTEIEKQGREIRVSLTTDESEKITNYTSMEEANIPVHKETALPDVLIVESVHFQVSHSEDEEHSISQSDKATINLEEDRLQDEGHIYSLDDVLSGEQQLIQQEENDPKDYERSVWYEECKDLTEKEEYKSDIKINVPNQFGDFGEDLEEAEMSHTHVRSAEELSNSSTESEEILLAQDTLSCEDPSSDKKEDIEEREDMQGSFIIIPEETFISLESDLQVIKPTLVSGSTPGMSSLLDMMSLQATDKTENDQTLEKDFVSEDEVGSLQKSGTLPAVFDESKAVQTLVELSKTSTAELEFSNMRGEETPERNLSGDNTDSKETSVLEVLEPDCREHNDISSGQAMHSEYYYTDDDAFDKEMMRTEEHSTNGKHTVEITDDISITVTEFQVFNTKGGNFYTLQDKPSNAVQDGKSLMGDHQPVREDIDIPKHGTEHHESFGDSMQEKDSLEHKVLPENDDNKEASLRSIGESEQKEPPSESGESWTENATGAGCLPQEQTEGFREIDIVQSNNIIKDKDSQMKLNITTVQEDHFLKLSGFEVDKKEDAFGKQVNLLAEEKSVEVHHDNLHEDSSLSEKQYFSTDGSQTYVAKEDKDCSLTDTHHHYQTDLKMTTPPEDPAEILEESHWKPDHSTPEISQSVEITREEHYPRLHNPLLTAEEYQGCQMEISQTLVDNRGTSIFEERNIPAEGMTESNKQVDVLLNKESLPPGHSEQAAPVIEPESSVEEIGDTHKDLDLLSENQSLIDPWQVKTSSTEMAGETDVVIKSHSTSTSDQSVPEKELVKEACNLEDAPPDRPSEDIVVSEISTTSNLQENVTDILFGFSHTKIPIEEDLSINGSIQAIPGPEIVISADYGLPEDIELESGHMVEEIKEENYSEEEENLRSTRSATDSVSSKNQREHKDTYPAPSEPQTNLMEVPGPIEEDDEIDGDMLPHRTLDLSAQKSRVQLRRKTSIRRRQGQRQSLPEAQPSEQPPPVHRPFSVALPGLVGKLPMQPSVTPMAHAVPPPAEERKEERADAEEIAIKPKKVFPKHAGFGIPHPQMMQELQSRLLKKKPKE